MTDTEREIKRLISYIRSCRVANIDCTVTIDKSLTHGVLNALEEIQQYREVGTVEEVKEAMAFYGNVKESSMIEIVEKCVEYEKIGTVEECRAAVEKLKKGDPIESK